MLPLTLLKMNLFFDIITYSVSVVLNFVPGLWFCDQCKLYYFWLILVIFLFEIKFSFVLGFLITIRVGTPRYRYDFLSKLGWLKLLSLSLTSFTTVLLWLVV